MDFMNKKILFSDMKKAEEFVSQCEKVFDEYDLLTVADVYELLRAQALSEDMLYGWIRKSDIMSIAIVPNGDNTTYRVMFPKPKYIAEPKLDMKTVCATKALAKEHKPMESDDPMVSHPSHYQSETGLEVIDVIEAFTFDLKGIEATDTGNVIKYICRWKGKNGLQDLKKAKWYLEHLINHVEKLEKENEQS